MFRGGPRNRAGKCGVHDKRVRGMHVHVCIELRRHPKELEALARKTWPEATDAAPSRNNPHTTRRDTPSLAHRCGHAGVLASHILLSLLILQLATLPHIVIRVWVRWNLLLVALLFEQLAVVVPLLRALVDVLLEGVHLQLPVAVELPVRTGELPNCRAVAVHHDHRTTVARVPDIARPLRLWIQLLRRQHSGPYDLVGVPGVLHLSDSQGP
eukprot:UN5176